ncbi:Transposase IS66 family protein [Prosthecobacter debontii]|uniref:Transposase IS66 family protein n=1 Tax=Prosthecobacter debontii TaxID=48467 RepID=A0A1T4XVZ6_9BACT|nr:transposase [Prosthecobacter debontii]SKA93368.1 Transposase IS66 family protein [Prosthecobacter debontii]
MRPRASTLKIVASSPTSCKACSRDADIYLAVSQAKAISYVLNLWDKLSVYLRDGRVCIDNNRIENAILPSAIGKKNWLFMGDPKSGDRAAVFYTLIGKCHREDITAEAYLTDLFTRLPTETNGSS